MKESVTISHYTLISFIKSTEEAHATKMQVFIGSRKE